MSMQEYYDLETPIQEKPEESVYEVVRHWCATNANWYPSNTQIDELLSQLKL